MERERFVGRLNDRHPEVRLTDNDGGCTRLPPGWVSWWPGGGNANILRRNNGTRQNGATFASGMVDRRSVLTAWLRLLNVPDAPNLDFNPTSRLPLHVGLRTSRTTSCTC